jgi:hypothetical protein
MSVSSGGEEVSIKREGEAKKKLKPKPLLPQIKTHESEERPTLRIPLTPEAETGIIAVNDKRQLFPRQGIWLSPLMSNTMKLLLKELKKMIGIENMKPTMVEAIAKTAKEIEVKGELKPKIPKVGIQPQTLKPSKIRVLIRTLPTEELKISLRSLKQVVNEITKGSSRMVRSREIVAKPMPRVVLPKPIKKEIFAIEEVEEPPKTPEEKSLGIFEEVFTPTLIEKLSPDELPLDRPVCIILSKRANDSFVMSVALICREIYRIVKGGGPDPRWISTGLKDEIERNLRAGDMIFIIDDQRGELLPDFSKIRSCSEFLEKVDREMLLDRLHEFFSQNLGFVIFHINEKWANQFAKVLEEKVGSYIHIVYMSPPNWDPQVKVGFAEACWGFVKCERCEDKTFDEIFGQCEKKFFGELKKLGEDVELQHYIEKDENASEEHESMKAIVVECLAKELGATSKEDVIQILKKDKIRTEYKLEDKGRADVYLTIPPGRFIEIETFYGRGDPVNRLNKDTLSKYKGKDINQVDIILLNGVQALLYVRRLVRLADLYWKEYSLKVNFYIPNINEKKLVPLRDVLDMLKNVISSLKPTEELRIDEVERLWNIFSQELNKCGIDPERRKMLFNVILDRSKSYQDNLNRILEEVRLLKESEGAWF